MLKMIKYEYRRGWFPLTIIFIIFGVLEAYFLGATLLEKEEHTAIAMGLLIFISFACYLFVMVYGIVSFNNDMKKKSGYLVFMTPISSYQVIGAKLISTLLTGITLVALIGVLFVIDYSVAAKVYHFEGVIDFLNELLKSAGTDLKSGLLGVLAFVIAFLIQFFTMIAVVYLAISLASTILENKKGKSFVSGMIAFALIMIIEGVSAKLLSINVVGNEIRNFAEAITVIWPSILFYLVVAILCFFASGALLEKKISL